MSLADTADAQGRGAEVIALARRMGFALAGVCEAKPSEFADELRKWLDQGRHGSMTWMERNVEVRVDPQLMLEGARSIVMVADMYAGRNADPIRPDDSEKSLKQGRIARYAQGDDYHVVMKQRLHGLCDALRETFPGEQFRAFVDTAPVLEREHAMRAGLGWVGKHTLLIHPELGSWFFLGGVLTTLHLAPPEQQRVIEDHCGTCTRCIDACPTDAITPYAVDARRCISYLTIEHRERVDEQFHEPMGDWLFGCDICQEVCPHNGDSPRSSPGLVNEAYQPRQTAFDLLEVLRWTEEDRRRAFIKSAMKRAKLRMMKRNALIVAGNALKKRSDAALAKRIGEIAEDDSEDEMVRETARQVSAD